MPRIDWVDLSKWQGVIPPVVFALWRQNGVQGVILKVGGGNAGRYQDSTFARNLTNARAGGLAVQGYWFNGETDPVADAEFAHTITPPGFFIWADVENEGSMPHWNPPQVNAFQTRLEQLGHPTGAYMSQSVTFGDWSLINHRPLWVAAYGPSTVPRVGSWRAPVLWQHSSSGQLPGYGARLDVNEVQPGFTTAGVTPIGDEFDMASLDDLAKVNEKTHGASFLPLCIQNREPGAGPVPGLAIFANGYVEAITSAQWDAYGMAGAKQYLTTSPGHFAFFQDQAAKLRASYGTAQQIQFTDADLASIAAQIAAAQPALNADQIKDAVADELARRLGS